MPLTAKQIIEKTIASNGGDHWKHPKTLILDGNARMYAQNEPDLVLNTYRMHRVFPDTNARARQANGKVAILAKSKDIVFFDLRFDGTTSDIYLSDRAKQLQDHFKWSNNFGFGIIRFAIDQNLEYSLTDVYHFGEIPCYYIKIKDASGQETIFGIEKEKFQILYMGFDTPLGFHLREYGNFNRDEMVPFVMPQSLKIYYDDFLWFEVQWETFKVNLSIEDKVFERSASKSQQN